MWKVNWSTWHERGTKKKSIFVLAAWVLIAQWIECLPSVWEVMGLIPVGDSDFFFVPHSCHVNQFTFHSTNLKYFASYQKWCQIIYKINDSHHPASIFFSKAYTWKEKLILLTLLWLLSFCLFELNSTILLSCHLVSKLFVFCYLCLILAILFSVQTDEHVCLYLVEATSRHNCL